MGRLRVDKDGLDGWVEYGQGVGLMGELRVEKGRLDGWVQCGEG